MGYLKDIWGGGDYQSLWVFIFQIHISPHPISQLIRGCFILRRRNSYSPPRCLLLDLCKWGGTWDAVASGLMLKILSGKLETEISWNRQLLPPPPPPNLSMDSMHWVDCYRTKYMTKIKLKRKGMCGHYQIFSSSQPSRFKRRPEGYMRARCGMRGSCKACNYITHTRGLSE